MNREVFEALIAWIEANKEIVTDEDDDLYVPYTSLAEEIARLYKDNH